MSGWGSRGSAHPRSTLTEDQVVQIKLALARGDRIVALAEQFGVSKSTISDIKTGKKWWHVKVPKRDG